MNQSSFDPLSTRMTALEERSAVPPWFKSTRSWTEDFHTKWTSVGWDPADAAAKILSPAQGLSPDAIGPMIRMPANVPVFLRGVLDCLNAAISTQANPNAPLRLSHSGIQTALDRL